MTDQTENVQDVTKSTKSVSLVSMIMAALGFIFWLGQMAGEARMEQAIDQYKKQVTDLNAQLENERKNIKEVVVKEYVDRVEYIEKINTVYQTQVVEVPSKCELAQGWVYLHDQAVMLKPADPVLSSDSTDSSVTDREALAIILDNYSACNKNSAQLSALLSYIQQMEQAVEQANQKIREINKPK